MDCNGFFFFNGHSSFSVTLWSIRLFIFWTGPWKLVKTCLWAALQLCLQSVCVASQGWHVRQKWTWLSWANLFLPFIRQWLFLHSTVLCFWADSVLKSYTNMATVFCINSRTIKDQSHFKVRLSFRVTFNRVNHTSRLRGQCWHVMLVAEIPEAHRAVISKGDNHYWLYQRLYGWCKHVYTHAPMHARMHTCSSQ